MYAIVKAGGRSRRSPWATSFTINRLAGEAGDTIALPALLLVDGDTVTSDAAGPGQRHGHRRGRRPRKGPKIRIHKFKNKTGYPSGRGTVSPSTERRGPRHLRRS